MKHRRWLTEGQIIALSTLAQSEHGWAPIGYANMTAGATSYGTGSVSGRTARVLQKSGLVAFDHLGGLRENARDYVLIEITPAGRDALRKHTR